MPDFVAHSSRWKLVLMLLGAVMFVVIGLWMVGLFGQPPESRRYSTGFLVLIGWACILFFGLCGGIIAKRLFSAGEDEVRISASGIRSRSWSDDMIPWSEITEISTWNSNGQSVIVLKLRDPSRYPGKGMVAMLAKANRAMTGGDVHISMTGTDRSFDEAMAAVRYFRH